MRDVCVIGGSRYFGKRLIDLFLEAGDNVTVINRGSAPSPPGVTHLIADRDDEAALNAVLGTRTFDVVLDQVCYLPEQAAVARRVFGDRTRRYVMTSTAEVYETLRASSPVAEDSVPWSDPGLTDYGRDKRRAEAVFLADPVFPFVSVRCAHVVGGGVEDFTGRLDHYVQRMRSGAEIVVYGENHPATFIHYGEIADFLFWAAGATFVGPVNACSHGELDVHAICDQIAAQGLPEPVYRIGTKDVSPYAFDHYYGLDNSRAVELGFRFAKTSDWLPGAIAELL